LRFQAKFVGFQPNSVNLHRLYAYFAEDRHGLAGGSLVFVATSSLYPL